ncbi:MAG: hypothetical protein GVY19_12630, partial [Bacteroidetes bacterium]|nr:hypothetical protein [Bacteroidota bacterium]
ISEGFTEQNNMLNSTMKMVRDKITATYDQKISDLYTPGAKNFFNDQNRQEISTLLT